MLPHCLERNNLDFLHNLMPSRTARHTAKEDSSQPFGVAHNPSICNEKTTHGACKHMKVKAEQEMTRAPRQSIPASWMAFAMLSLLVWTAHAQTCQTSSDMDEATRSAISTSAQRYFTMAAGGDTASLRQSAIPSLAGDFSGIEGLVKARQPDLAGGQPTVHATFLLEEQGVAPDAHAEFYCGVFGKNGQTPTSAAFYLDNLPPGKYGVVLDDVASPKGRTYFSVILQQSGTDWKLGGLYIKPAQIGGHDNEWFATRARDYKTKGQLYNAALYYQEARNLTSPVPFMGTLATDKLYDESQGAQVTDFPSNGKLVDFLVDGATYKVSGIYPTVVGSDLDVVVKYQVADAANTNQCYQSNMAIMKGLVTRYPELRDAFAGVETRASDASGKNYGTLMPMKEIK